MDFEELENILRSWQTEDEGMVMLRLCQAIGRQCDYEHVELVIEALWDGHYSRI